MLLRPTDTRCNIKLTIEYDGTAYHGWQIQPNVPTVQGVLQATLERITQESVQVIGSGRTDTGVHATGQVAHFHTHSRIPPVGLQRALNALLPDDVVVRAAESRSLDFHARYDALCRTYEYTLLNRATPSALDRHHVLHEPRDLQVEQTDLRVKQLVGTHDFASFQKTGSDRQDAVCTVYEAGWSRVEERVIFRITANAFVRGMVRAIVGTCLKYQAQPHAVQIIQQILDARDRARAGPTAPAKGLCLVHVEYDPQKVEPGR